MASPQTTEGDHTPGRPRVTWSGTIEQDQKSENLFLNEAHCRRIEKARNARPPLATFGAETSRLTGALLHTKRTNY